MLNTTILDVAIGMIFIYLLLSLLCSAANELIELVLKKRATDLERGIRELLKPDSTSGGADIVQKLYNHPLINGLFPGKYEDSHIGSGARYLIGTKLPSYIPARNFALALMDLILPGSPAGAPSGAAGATAPSAPPPSKTTAAVTQPSAAATTTVPPSPNAPPASANQTSGPTPTVPPAPNATAVALNSSSAFRAALDKLKTSEPEIATALTTLVDAAGDDVARARTNIEDWFNSSMDRVSGWYKRRTQIILLVLGLLIAILLNVDSVFIFRRLASDRPLRDSLVAAADAYAKANATASPSPSPSTSPTGTASPKTTAPSGNKPSGQTGAGAGAPTASPAATPAATSKATPSSTPAVSPTASASASSSPAATASGSPSASASGSPAASTSPTPKPTPCNEIACPEGKDAPQCKLAKAQCEISNLTLPIGWSSPDDPMLMWPGWDRDKILDQVGMHLLGWLLTALAISLGAPFWFDMLNKFIVVRSTVKPKEKSPEEKPK